MAAETVMEPARIIAQELPHRFRMWIESLSGQTGERPLQGIKTNSKVLCFNYTEFIEDIYGVSHRNICYIHGCRKKQKDIPKRNLFSAINRFGSTMENLIRAGSIACGHQAEAL